MKTFKIIGIIVGSIAIIAIAGIIYIKTALPDVGPPPEIDVDITPESVERGEYLANHVLACMDCHSTRDWSKFSGPLVEGTLGKGGEIFNHDFGFPGVFTSKNITPSGIEDWTDGELYRLITTGVTRTGEPIFPVMPYPAYKSLAEKDVKDVIVYLRTLEPIQNEVPKSKADFPMNIIMHTMPKPADPQPMPPKSDVLKYGEYMTKAAACTDCHTPKEKGAPVMELYMAGGFAFKIPGFGVVRSSNLTPDSSGIGTWTEKQFVDRFKMYADTGYVSHEVEQNEFQTVMPWTMYADIKEEDLKAMFAYLKSLEPIENSVQKFTPESALE